MTRLEHLRRLHEAATKAEWRSNKYGGIGAGEFGTDPTIINGDGWGHDWTAVERERHTADKALISAARKRAARRVRAGGGYTANREWPVL